MGTSIDEKVKVGEWIRPSMNHISHALYINVTQRNIQRINDSFKDPKTRDNYIRVEGDEIKNAENYLEALKGIKPGDYIRVVSGEIDKIVVIPKVEHPDEVESYSGIVKAERDLVKNWKFLLDCPNAKISREEAKKYTEDVLVSYEARVSFYKKRLKEFKSRRWWNFIKRT
jgi:hypothetical protein